jgi:ribonuclease BN (tRNA processing enzyme)
MRLTIIGCGDAFSAGGRYQSCYLLDTSAGRLMLDCGATTLTALKHSGVAPNSVDALLISHLHGDHFGGVPFFFLDALFVSRREKPLPIFGPKGCQERVEALIENLFPRGLSNRRRFEMSFHDIEGATPLDCQGISVLPVEVVHESGAPAYALRMEADGRLFAYSGDTGWCDGVIEAGRDADLYLMECSTYDFKLSMHLDYLTIAEHFDRIGAKRYLFAHMNEDMIGHPERIDQTRCAMAEDGLVIDI